VSRECIQASRRAGVDQGPASPGVACRCLEAAMGFEPMIRVLQTLALPLGYGRCASDPAAAMDKGSMVLLIASMSPDR
jgi:hypothetical protein